MVYSKVSNTPFRFWRMKICISILCNISTILYFVTYPGEGINYIQRYMVFPSSLCLYVSSWDRFPSLNLPKNAVFPWQLMILRFFWNFLTFFWKGWFNCTILHWPQFCVELEPLARVSLWEYTFSGFKDSSAHCFSFSQFC